ncbi:hypothetical protein [Flavobacterium sp. CGRL2]
MTFPFQFEIFEKTFYWHFIFETLAFFVGIRMYYFLKKRTQDSISDTNRLVIMIGAMVGALIGSRFIALLENPSQITHQTFLTLYQNKTVAGGFLGGLFGVELIKKSDWRKIFVGRFIRNSNNNCFVYWTYWMFFDGNGRTYLRDRN